MQHKLKYIENIFKDVTFDRIKITSKYKKQKQENNSITIKLISIFGGIFSSMVFVVFIAISGLWSNGILMGIFGALIIIFSIIFSTKIESSLLDTFNISAYIIGIIMLIFSMEFLKIPMNNTIFVILILGLITLLISQNNLFIFIASLIVQGSILFFIFYNHFENYISIFILLNIALLIILSFNEATFIRLNSKKNQLLYPIKMAIIISILFSFSLLLVNPLVNMDRINRNLLTIGIGITFLFTIHQIIIKTKTTNKKVLFIIYGSSILVALTALYAPTIIGGLTLILIGFYNQDKIGFILGILSFIAFTGMFYYNLNETLLFKSILLMVIGIVFLALYVLISKNKSFEKI